MSRHMLGRDTARTAVCDYTRRAAVPDAALRAVTLAALLAQTALAAYALRAVFAVGSVPLRVVTLVGAALQVLSVATAASPIWPLAAVQGTPNDEASPAPCAPGVADAADAARGGAPRVDLLVTVCGEELSVVQDTVMAALHNCDYPAYAYRVLVLDDGGSDALEAWVRGLQEAQPGWEHDEATPHTRLLYCRRAKPPGLPHHYKAGNMNAALCSDVVTSWGAPLVAQLDADMIPARSFLSTMVARLSAAPPSTAYAYCVQTFYNWGPMDLLDDAQQMNYMLCHPKFSALRVAPNGGSGVLWRADALRAMGGFRTDSLGEDYLTGWDALARGHTSVFVRSPLQAGLVPWTLAAWLKQQRRWWISELEMSFLLWRPLIASLHLAWWQKHFLVLTVLTRPFLVLATTLAGVCLSLLVLCAPISLFRALLLTSNDAYIYQLLCAAVVVRLLATLQAVLPVLDAPNPVSLWMRAFYVPFQVPLDCVWWLQVLLGRPGFLWGATGAAAAGSGGGLLSTLLAHVGPCCWLYLLHLVAFIKAAAYVFILGSRTWTIVAVAGCASAALDAAYFVLPVYYYTHWMPAPGERARLVPRRSDGVPDIGVTAPCCSNGQLAIALAAPAMQAAVGAAAASYLVAVELRRAPALAPLFGATGVVMLLVVCGLLGLLYTTTRTQASDKITTEVGSTVPAPRVCPAQAVGCTPYVPQTKRGDEEEGMAHSSSLPQLLCLESTPTRSSSAESLDAYTDI